MKGLVGGPLLVGGLGPGPPGPPPLKSGPVNSHTVTVSVIHPYTVLVPRKTYNLLIVGLHLEFWSSKNLHRLCRAIITLYTVSFSLRQITSRPRPIRIIVLVIVKSKLLINWRNLNNTVMKRLLSVLVFAVGVCAWVYPIQNCSFWIIFIVFF